MASWSILTCHCTAHNLLQQEAAGVHSETPIIHVLAWAHFQSLAQLASHLSAFSSPVFTLFLDADNHCSNYLSVCSWNIAAHRNQQPDWRQKSWRGQGWRGKRSGFTLADHLDRDLWQSELLLFRENCVDFVRLVKNPQIWPLSGS